MSFTSLLHSAAVANIKVYLAIAAPYTAAGALLLAILALLMIMSLRGRLRRLSLGRSGSLEETLGVLTRDTKDLQEFRGEVEKYLKLAELRLRSSVQGVGLVRFNPFEGQGQGGNQSFAVAFLDEYLNGIVFSTLYARDRVGVYSKPIEKGSSTYELTGEEKEAIERAKSSLVSHKKK